MKKLAALLCALALTACARTTTRTAPCKCDPAPEACQCAPMSEPLACGPNCGCLRHANPTATLA